MGCRCSCFISLMYTSELKCISIAFSFARVNQLKEGALDGQNKFDLLTSSQISRELEPLVWRCKAIGPVIFRVMMFLKDTDVEQRS